MEKYKIKNLGTIISGGTPSTSNENYWDGNIIWITPKDLSKNKCKYIYTGERNISKDGLEHSSAKLLPKNAVLLSSRAPIGYLALAGCELTTNQGFKSIVCILCITSNTTSLFNIESSGRFSIFVISVL